MKRYSKTLRTWLKSNPSFDDRLNILCQIIKILHSVHTSGYVHADLKLENIMLTSNNEVRIIDWGLAGPNGHACIHLTTRIYRPKHVIQDFCHDIYSLGILSIELLLGTLIINTLDYQACVNLIRSTNLNKSLKSIITKMIHPDCDKRPTISKIASAFSLNTITYDITQHMEHIDIPPDFGIPSREYPNIFKQFIDHYPYMKDNIYCIIGAIYGSKYYKILPDYMKLSHLLIFFNSL
jgi:serine/threonine protein kinase